MDELSLLKALLLKVLAQGSLRDIDDLHLALRLVDVRLAHSPMPILEPKPVMLPRLTDELSTG